MKKRLIVLCAFCEENKAEAIKAFHVGEESVAFCSDICAEYFIDHLSEKERKLISINQCCHSPQFIESRGTVVCTNCGLDQQEKIYDTGPEFQKRERMSLKNLEDRYDFYISILKWSG